MSAVEATREARSSEAGERRPARDVLRERIASASDTVEVLDAFRKYSAERCVELNSDGTSWTCPEDTVGLPIDETTIDKDARAVRAIVERLNPRRCR